MTGKKKSTRSGTSQDPLADEFALAEAGSGFGAFEWDLSTNQWRCNATAAALFRPRSPCGAFRFRVLGSRRFLSMTCRKFKPR